MNELKRTLLSVTWQLHANALLRCLLLAGSAYFFTATFAGFSLGSLLAGFAGFAVGAFLSKPFQDKKPQAIRLIHQTVGEAEYSLPLLDKPHLNIAEQLQLDRLGERVQTIRVTPVWVSKAGLYGAGLLAALAVYFGYPLLQQNAPKPEKQVRSAAASVPESKPVAPVFQSASLRIQPPAYTRLPATNSAELNATATVGAVLTWQFRFSDHRYLSVRLVNGRGQEIPFRASDDGFSYQDRLLNSGLYAIKAYWRGSGRRDSLVYQSDFYRLEAKPDLAPKIEPDSKELYRFHTLNDPKTLNVAARFSDDFSVSQAFMVATVARGSGENVKFREIRLPLAQANFSEAQLTKTIDLNALKFAPGDELYYYWAAFDNRQPEPNFTKSDTYFIVYKDTTKVDESELATMAVNIMPEYFRSQRQIIIDTEKLIASRKKRTAQRTAAQRDAAQQHGTQTFNSTSNEIGFDQKALRLRYGQFLGEEFEQSIGGGGAPPTDHEGDVVAGFVNMDQYMHKHDEGEGDHSAPPPAHNDDHNHSHGSGGADDSQDPLAALMAQYVHEHDDAETNTFHEESTRSLLKTALENMWQSELHLRLYEPEKALPFEQKALEYLKLSQQKARSYVRKTGFDPPPIKEKELRLTGELKNVSPTHQQERTFTPQQLGLLVAGVLGYLDLPQLSSAQRGTVQQLGNALANQTLNSGLRNWSVLASLQKLAGGNLLSAPEKDQLKTKLYALISGSKRAEASYTSDRTLEKAFWRHLK